ncbi:CCR4 [Symbiodinium natans]|uniref:CCR4 protein n=1 Tax=Symbiodinium natans TaxID=878477 RepID=A0A812GAQ8_9DINO|nr:CCR4 [Symbiodinium natans]
MRISVLSYNILHSAAAKRQPWHWCVVQGIPWIMGVLCKCAECLKLTLFVASASPMLRLCSFPLGKELVWPVGQASEQVALAELVGLQRVAELVLRLSPDIACLQELLKPEKSTNAPICPEMLSLCVLAALASGQNGQYRKCHIRKQAVILQNEELPAKDGCAIFTRTDLPVTRTYSFRIRDVAERLDDSVSLPATVSYFTSSGRHYPTSLDIRGSAGLGAASSSDLVRSRHISSACPRMQTSLSTPWGEALWRELHEKLSVSTSHLYWDPRYPDLKLLQAFLLARELEAVAAPNLILAGDLNSTPLVDGRSSGDGDLSGVYQLFTTGSVSASHPHHPVRMRPGSGILRGVSTKEVPDLQVLPFYSAYKEADGREQAVTNLTREFHGCLDYILYRGRSLEAVLGHGCCFHKDAQGENRLKTWTESEVVCNFGVFILRQSSCRSSCLRRPE